MMQEGARAGHDTMPASEFTLTDGRQFSTMYSDPATAARQVEGWLLEAEPDRSG